MALLTATARASGTAAPSMAAPWMTAPYNDVIVSQSVQAVLKAFGKNTGVHVSVSPDVSGVVHGNISSKDAEAFLDNVTRQNGLDWYFDGAVLYVTPTGDERSAVVSLRGREFATIASALRQRGLLDGRYGFRPDGADGVLVSGPPAYVSVVTDAIDSMAPQAHPTGQAPALTIYRGVNKSSVSF